MKRLLIVFAGWMLLVPVAAQPVVFQGRIVPLGDEPLPADLRLRAEQIGPIDHGQSGEFRLALPPGTTRFTLHVVRPALEVVYPPGGQVTVPADPTATTIVVVGPATETVINEALAARDRQLERRLRAYDLRLDAQQDSLRRDLRAILDALLGLRQDELPEILNLLRLREADLRSALEQQQQREAYLPALAHALNDYVLKAKDLRYALETLGPDSPLSRAVNEAMQDAVQRYDTAYTALNNAAPAFEQQIRAYWDDEALAADFREVLTLARGEIHHDRVLQLNGPLLTVQRVFTNARPDRDDVAYSRRRIADIAADLEPRIDRLGVMVAELLANLSRL